MALHYFVLALSLSFSTVTASLLVPESTAGTQACANLTSILGNSKVDSNRLSLKYINTQQDYWNAKQSEYVPSCIVYPKSANDVSVALQGIKAAGSRFAIKAGGHNGNDFFSSVQGGVLIDVNQMTKKSYDADTTLATYEPGGNWGDLYKYYQKYGRTVVGGRLSGVGTGLALGGGLSYLSPQYGMACDSFRELEVVLPSGKIVKASANENPDLFFGLRAGGGNAYGVVTKYTVQTRPIGTFTAGNLIFPLAQNNDVLEAIGNFSFYNTDPKASIIGTYEKLGTPSVTLNLDQVIIMFIVYDGEDPGHVYDNFTSLHPLVNTISHMSYTEVANLPFVLPVTTELSRGDNIFRVSVKRISETDKSYITAFETWDAWCQAHKGKYAYTSIDFQPIPKSLTDASAAANGGNAMQMPDGPWIWLNFVLSAIPGLNDAQYNALQDSFRAMVQSIPNAEGLPLFLNDANSDQDPLKTFSTYQRLQGIKKKYDPEEFFSNYTGGWSFS